VIFTTGSMSVSPEKIYINSTGNPEELLFWDVSCVGFVYLFLSLCLPPLTKTLQQREKGTKKVQTRIQPGERKLSQ